MFHFCSGSFESVVYISVATYMAFAIGIEPFFSFGTELAGNHSIVFVRRLRLHRMKLVILPRLYKSSML